MVNSRRIGLFSNARDLQRGLVGGVADSAPPRRGAGQAPEITGQPRPSPRRPTGGRPSTRLENPSKALVTAVFD